MIDPAETRQRLNTLTSTQLLVLQLSMRGDSTGEVAGALRARGRVMSLRTIEVHRDSVVNKIGIRPFRRLIPTLWEFGLAQEILRQDP